MSGPAQHLLWFRNQLRIHDQPLFAEVDHAESTVVGVWILDPRSHQTTVEGFPRTGPHRMAFLLESVAALRSNLRRLGSDLIIRVGEPETILPELANQLGVTSVRAVREPGTEEQHQEATLATRLGAKWYPQDPECLFAGAEAQDLAAELPEVFSRFRRRAEKKLEFAPSRAIPPSLRPIQLPPDCPAGSLPELETLGLDPPPADERAVLAFCGGEDEGLARLEAWIFRDDRLQHYKVTRNGMLGEAYSSKFSPWLANGSLSARLVVEETLRYEAERVANDSTYWLRFELLWREYFRLYLIKHGASLFAAEGPSQRNLGWSGSDAYFQAWRQGRTGVPLVDANMIELERTGFMSNRGRQIVASFLSKNLDVDWRRGARWFEHALVDYCPAANWGNWAYAAGVGADPRGFRGFDIARQAQNYDPQGEYVATWLGDTLRDRPASQRHAPWEYGGPPPLVDPARSLAAAKRRWERLVDDS